MEVKLNLSEGHCIETAANEKYEEFARRLIKEKDEEMEKKLSFLKDFLESADFQELRADGFDGSEEVVIRLRRKDSGFSVEKV